MPPCTKLQIPNASSPAKTPSPTLSANENANVSSRKQKNHKPVVVNVADDSAVVQRTSEKCDRDNVSSAAAIRDEIGACKPKEIEVSSSELEVTVTPEPTKNISMNSLLSPLNQTYQETQDNNLDRKTDGTN